jgi:hypothetical protein
MCKENKEYFIILLVGLLLSCVVGVLQAEEPDRWYLISEQELRSIEGYKANSEREKTNWLLQVNDLKTRAERLNERAANSLAELENSNRLLSTAREQNRTLQQSYEKSEAEKLTLISLKNGEIADLKQEVADKTLEAETYKGKAALRLLIIISLGLAIAAYIAFKVLRFIRIIPI